MKRLRKLLVIGAATALVATGCSRSDPEPTGSVLDPASATDADGDATDAAKPITIGVLTSFTGPFTPWGVQAAAGMAMAAEDINDAGGVDGRTIELVEADDQNNPEEGVSSLERMVEQDGIVAAGGVISSDVGLATGAAAEELEVPLLLVKAGADSILTPDSRYTFRTCLPAAPMIAGPLVTYIQEHNITRVGAIVADYAWGQSVKAAIEADIGSLEGVELQVEVAPVTETDFTTYLRNLEALDPEVIVASGHPPGGAPIVQQANDLGFDVPVTGSYNPFATIVDAVGDVAFDTVADFGCADFASDDYQELARAFAERTDFAFMEADAVAGYGIVTMVAEAVTEVGDDPVAVAEYLHANTFELPGYAFDLNWTEYGEMAEATPHLVIIRETTPPEGVNPGANWYPETLAVPEPLEPYVPQ